MNLAVFFKVQPLIKEITEFLSLIANSVETEVELIFKFSLDSYILFQNTENLEDFKQILYQSMSFLLKKGNKNEILKYFNNEFFKKLENNQIVEKSFTFFVEIIKASKSCSKNQILMEFLILFKNKLIEFFQKELPNFNNEKYFMEFIQNNIDFGNLNSKDYKEKLEMEFNFKTKDFMNCALGSNIHIGKKDINKVKDEVLSLGLELKESTKHFENIMKENFKGIKSMIEVFEKNQLINLDKISREIEDRCNQNLNNKIKTLEDKLRNEEENRIKSEANFIILSMYVFSTYIFDSKTIPNGAFKLSNFNLTVKKMNQTND